MGVAELEYEPNAAGRPVWVEREGGVTRVVVAMPGPYVPIWKWAWDLDLFSIVVVPVCWVGSLVWGVCFGRVAPPRAVFEVGGERFRMVLWDPGSGERSEVDWPRGAVAAARANRYERGLWVDVPGYVKTTYLKDLSRETIGRLEAALGEALWGGGGASAG